MTIMTRCMLFFCLLSTVLAAQGSVQTSISSTEFDEGLTGRVSMQGSIMSKACDIAMESHYQSVEMGTENIKQLSRAGRGMAKSFSIHLVDCSFDAGAVLNAPWHYLQVTFEGAGDDGLFTVSGGTRGVALEISEKGGDIARPGRPMPFVTINNDDIRLDYELRLRTTNNNLQPGDYSSVIKYRIDYF